jgi:hypothetical protein
MLPAKLARSVRRLAKPELLELRDLVDDLLAALDEPPDPPTRASREVVRRTARGSVTYQLERVYCGKACRGCPHGPYWYAYYRSGGRVVSRYIGKVLA